MKKNILVLATIILALSITSCIKSEQDSEVSIPAYFLQDHIMNETLHDLRLADGAPISIDVTYRWRVQEVDSFVKTFSDPMQFDSLILKPRAREIADIIAVKFSSIDSVFTTQRELFGNTLRQEILFGLGGNEALIKEVILTGIHFPPRYTRALEDISLKKKEIERIKQQSLVDLAQSDANKKKTKLDGLVMIEKAEADGRLEKIKATTEKNRRASQLALAETQAQVAQLQADSEARKREIALQVELRNKQQLKELERQDLSARNSLALSDQKQKDQHQLLQEQKKKEQEMSFSRLERQEEFDMEIQFASLCTSNPLYADFLVNKELASHVEIAILPTETEMGLFENVLNNKMTTRQ